MISRDHYLQKLIDFKDTTTIKVITGMRRCGKSSLLMLYQAYLKTSGVTDDQIVYMNFESLKNQAYTDYLSLYSHIKDMVLPNQKLYILLDEIQQVESWEKAINSLSIDFDVDLYLTGSNAYLLSSELSTFLSGRYIEIKMLPLSFKEYLLFNEILKPETSHLTKDAHFQNYLQYGSLPVIFEHQHLEEVFSTLILGIYHTVMIKDILERNKVNDVKLLNDVIRFAFDNVGNLISSKKISDFLSSDGKKTTHVTVLNYLQMFENAYILYPARRYDLKGKNYLKTLDKYYIVDTGIRNAVLGYRNADIGHILENIVYLELVRRGYDVCVGVYRDFEIDFVATNIHQKLYIQVTQSLTNENVLKREIRALEAIEDNYPKIILTMDRTFILDQEGILIKNIVDFLLEEA